MKKRIFLGINISGEFKRKIAKFREKYQDLPVRWMPDENLHLTLIPPVDLDDNQIVEMIEKLKEIEGKIGGVKINFNLITLGPNLRRPRIIWVEGEKNNQLLVLKDGITRVLGYNLDQRPYRPHLTLARFNAKDIVKIKEKIYPHTKNFGVGVNWQEDINSFSIIQSERLEKGAVYTILDTIQL